MPTTFIQEVARIAGELRRANLADEIKNAINDAIQEAAETRFWFNEVRDLAIVTVANTDNVSDQNLTEIDVLYVTIGGSRTRIVPKSNDYINVLTASGTVAPGQPFIYSRVASSIRLYPTPDAVYNLSVSGYGRLTPYPLVNDTDTSAWINEGERYIRNLAKRNVLRDVVKDYQEASVADAIATDIRTEFISTTTERISTGRLAATQW